MPPRLFNGHGTEFVTVKNRNFRHDRIFATFAGVSFRKRDTISPAKNVLVARARPQDWAGCAPHQSRRFRRDPTIGLENNPEHTGYMRSTPA
jgi:hypothetical protein